MYGKPTATILNSERLNDFTIILETRQEFPLLQPPQHYNRGSSRAIRQEKK